MPRPLVVFAGVLAVAGILYWQVGFLVPRMAYWCGALVLAAGAAFFSRSRISLGDPGSGGAFLCDSCRYNYGDVCRRPERPNATRCPDYQRS